MINLLYVVHNKLTGRFENLLVFPTDSMAQYQLNSMISAGKFDTNVYEVYFVGSLSVEDGSIHPSDKVLLQLNSNSSEV